MMIKSTLIIVVMLFSFSAFSQTDFSGTWILAKSKSTLNADFSMAPEKLVVTQEANSLKLERHSVFQGNSITSESTYTMDGEDCVNKGWQDVKITSNVNWSEDKKELQIATIIPMQDGSELKINESYALVDGELSIQSKGSSTWGIVEETWRFVKE